MSNDVQTMDIGQLEGELPRARQAVEEAAERLRAARDDHAAATDRHSKIVNRLSALQVAQKTQGGAVPHARPINMISRGDAP